MSEAVYKSIERYWIARAQVAEAERDALSEKLARASMCLEFIGCEENEEGRLARKALAAIKEGGA